MNKPLPPKEGGHNTGGFSQLDKDDLRKQIDRWSGDAKQADRLLVEMIRVMCPEARSGNWKFFGVYKGDSAGSFEIVHLEAEEAGWNSYVSPGHVNTITWPPFNKG